MVTAMLVDVVKMVEVVGHIHDSILLNCPENEVIKHRNLYYTPMFYVPFLKPAKPRTFCLNYEIILSHLILRCVENDFSDRSSDEIY